MMKRSIPAAIIFAFLISSTNQVFAAPKIGTACTKLSSFQQSSGTLLVCDVVKKKKVWRKANSIEKSLYQREKNRLDRAAAQKIIDETAASLAEKEAAEKLAAEKVAAEKLAAEKLAAEKLAAEKAAAEKAAAEKLAAEKLAAEKAAAEKAAAEKAAAAAKAAADAAAKAAADAAAKAAADAAAKAAAVPTVTVLSIFGRAYQNTGNTWYIPITNSSSESVPSYSTVQIKYGSLDWTDVGAGRNCGTYGCGAIVTGFVDVCPQFRLIARSNGIINTIWTKGPSSGGTC
jgi:hypothetical protein